MSSFLVLYGTGEGQTATVADRVGERLSERGHDATVVDVEAFGDASATDVEAFEDASVDPVGAHDAAILGSAIHYGKHHAGLRSFVEEHAESLADLPTAFFQVSLSSAVDDPERRAEAARYVDDLLEATGLAPDRIALFGGALRYSKYGFLKRLLMKRIARDATGDVDASRDYEYTDWDAVDDFAADVAAFVERRLDDS